MGKGKHSLQGKRIWVIDDEGTTTDMLKMVLGDEYGATVEDFGHQAEAMGRLIKMTGQKDAQYPDIIVTDATYAPTPKVRNPFFYREEEEEMPNAGQELIKYMAKDPKTRKIPIILLTGGNFNGISFPNTTIAYKGVADVVDLVHEKLSVERGR